MRVIGLGVLVSTAAAATTTSAGFLLSDDFDADSSFLSVFFASVDSLLFCFSDFPSVVVFLGFSSPLELESDEEDDDREAFELFDFDDSLELELFENRF